MDRFLVEVTVVQTVSAKSKKDAEMKAIKAIPMVIFEHFQTNVEVNQKAA